jgi:hypothetical protein
MSRSFMPNGNISPSRFVMYDNTKTGGYVIQATANAPIAGISQPGVRQPPMAGLDDGFAGVQDSKEITVFTETDTCWVEVAGAVNFGDYLMSDGNGRASTAAATGNEYGAQALQSATALGQLIKAKVLIGRRSA